MVSSQQCCCYGSDPGRFISGKTAEALEECFRAIAWEARVAAFTWSKRFDCQCRCFRCRFVRATMSVFSPGTNKLIRPHGHSSPELTRGWHCQPDPALLTHPNKRKRETQGQLINNHSAIAGHKSRSRRPCRVPTLTGQSTLPRPRRSKGMKQVKVNPRASTEDRSKPSDRVRGSDSLSNKWKNWCSVAQRCSS